MKTDACNVEEMNILHIKERLLLSCVASFQDWSNIFRNRSFTLCKNDRDFSERFDSVAVSESIPSLSMTSLSPFLLQTFHQISTLEKTTFRQYSILSSLMRSQVSPFLVAAHSTSSEVFDFHVWFSLGFLVQSRQAR